MDGGVRPGGPSGRRRGHGCPTRSAIGLPPKGARVVGRRGPPSRCGRLRPKPGALMPSWHSFLASVKVGKRARGISESIDVRLRGPELSEAHIHEALTNLAFAGGTPFWLLCPYDTKHLPAAVLDQALHHHPFVSKGVDAAAASERYQPTDPASDVFREPLSPVPAAAATFHFDRSDLAAVRRAVGGTSTNSACLVRRVLTSRWPPTKSWRTACSTAGAWGRRRSGPMGESFRRAEDPRRRSVQGSTSRPELAGEQRVLRPGAVDGQSAVRSGPGAGLA